MKWIRWGDCYTTSPPLSPSLVYCSSYSAKTLIDSLDTLERLRSVIQSGFSCQDGQSNLADQGQLPASLPNWGRWKRLIQYCIVILCILAGTHNPIFKILWCHCTRKKQLSQSMKTFWAPWCSAESESADTKNWGSAKWVRKFELCFMGCCDS